MVYHVYILASACGVLYTGVTRELERRVGEHHRDVVDGFTKRYEIHRLVYFEAFGDIRNAIAREKQLKGWRREKKIALIRKENPRFGNLSGRLWQGTGDDADDLDGRSIAPRSLHCAGRRSGNRAQEKSGPLRSG
jgi:putative endonuclease